MRRVFLLATVAGTLTAAPAADAAERLVIKGAGFGHGVGMSQYGALGQAQLGRSYRDILGHYYAETALSRLTSSPVVRVLLQSGRRTVTFTGAAQAGTRHLQPGKTYKATAAGASVVLRSSSNRRLKTFPAPLRIVGPSRAPVRVAGGSNSGAYRGAVELRPATLGGLNVINAVGLEDYVRGVVSRESPSSWPAEALKAQAIAARTYAITTSKGGDGWDQYPDVRSQVYAGVAAETPTTDDAVVGTRSEVVTYRGRPVTTFFFSTSGGRTENYEFGFLGGLPKPWLKSVDDPYDKVSPRHRWDVRLTEKQAEDKLGSLVKGDLEEIKVVQRGVSPRVVKAEVVGSRGVTATDGPTLRRELGLYDTWANFTIIGAEASNEDDAAAEGEAGGTQVSEDPAPAGAYAASVRTRGTISGRIRPVRRGTEVLVQRRTAPGTWRTEVRTHVGKGGRYRAGVSRTGAYRTVVNGLAGPIVRLR